jgi:hypothetical protein
MINVQTGQLPDKVGDVKASLRKFNMRTIHRMSGFQRKVEIDSMFRAPKGQHSPAGTPPFTHPKTSKKGNTLPAFPQFIRYKIEGSEFAPRSVVGPTKPSLGRRSNWAERIGHTHEFGGTTTVEKRVVYRPARVGEKGTYLGGMKRGFGLVRSTSVVLFKDNGAGGKDKTFDFTVRRVRSSTRTGKIIFDISYRATYPKRPFAAPALRKTIAAVRQGKFGQ